MSPVHSVNICARAGCDNPAGPPFDPFCDGECVRTECHSVTADLATVVVQLHRISDRIANGAAFIEHLAELHPSEQLADLCGNNRQARAALSQAHELLSVALTKISADVDTDLELAELLYTALGLSN